MNGIHGIGNMDELDKYVNDQLKELEEETGEELRFTGDELKAL